VSSAIFDGDDWQISEPLSGADVVLAFGARALLERSDILAELRQLYGGAPVLAATTAGEIHGSEVRDGSVVSVAIRFERSLVRGAQVTLEGAAGSRRSGRALAEELMQADAPCHVFVLSEGVDVNGSELVRGLADVLPATTIVTGGLAADGDRFERTLVGWEDGIAPGRVAALALYGKHLRIGCGSLGGWDPFGPHRLVTRSEGNVLYEVDGEPALGLYKKYLGAEAAGLPSSALRFPLCLSGADGAPGVVRTVLGVREEEGALVFAGDIPVGSHAQLMKANFDRLVDGAAGAADVSCGALAGERPELAILISCVGRKLVLGQQIEEEIESAREVLGAGVPTIGFYSYGEISPFTPTARCELHNQTMTITTLLETKEIE
jgi:hypothetical protein